VNGKWLWLVHTIQLDLYSVDIFCTVTGLHAAFVGGVLRVFDEINLFIQGVTGGTDQTSGGCSLC